MGVLKIYQKLSKMEFYKNALVIRRMLTDWLKRDFGLKSRATSIDGLFKEIPDCDDRDNLVRIFKKYGIDNKIYIERVPNWYLDSQKKYLLELCRELVTNIVAANVLNPKFIKEHIERRLYQDRAIAVCAKLIYDSGAGIKGKGVRFSRERLVAHLQKYYKEKKTNVGYIAIGDFKNYYGSIVHHNLMMMVERLISDVRILNLIYAGIAPYGDGVSLGLGSDSVTILASLYATPIDNYCKIVRSCKYYGRHNDDFYIISSDIGFLKDMLTNIDRIATSMGLKLNSRKTQIYRIDKGFKYLQQKIILTETSRVVMIPNSNRIAAEKHKLKSLKKKGRPYDYIYKQYYDFRGSMLKYDAYHSIKSADNYFNKLFDKEITWKY